jgi:hypothetical protein
MYDYKVTEITVNISDAFKSIKDVIDGTASEKRCQLIEEEIKKYTVDGWELVSALNGFGAPVTLIFKRNQ